MLKIIKVFREFFKYILELISSLYTTSKFLLVVGTICFFIITVSTFVPNIDATGNLVTIRTLFSSIIGSVLEKTSRRVLCDDRVMAVKNYCIGIMAVVIVLVIGLTVVFKVDVNNPSLILLKNTAFSCIGFLISSTKDCE